MHRFILFEKKAKAYESKSLKGRPEFWMEFEPVRGWPTKVRISKKMYELLQMALDSGELKAYV